MNAYENQSPALAWIAASLAMPQFFNDEMQKHVNRVNTETVSEINEIDK